MPSSASILRLPNLRLQEIAYPYLPLVPVIRVLHGDHRNFRYRAAHEICAQLRGAVVVASHNSLVYQRLQRLCNHYSTRCESPQPSVPYTQAVLIFDPFYEGRRLSD
jgi:hypothetical protein